MVRCIPAPSFPPQAAVLRCFLPVPRVRSALKINVVPVIRHSRHVSASARLLPAGCRMKMMYVTPAVLFGCGSHIHLHDSKKVRGRDDVG